MPSHLTRLVFRQILSNEPIIYRGCLRRPSAPSHLHRHAGHSAHRIQRRSFWPFQQSQPIRRVKPAAIAPGLKTLQDLERAQHLQTHLPKPQDLVKGLNTFFKSKVENQAPLQDYEVNYALAALQHLKSVSISEEKDYLADVHIIDGLKSLLVVPSSSIENHIVLARTLGEEERARHARRAKGDVVDEAVGGATEHASIEQSPWSLLFTKVMASYGQCDQALEGAVQQERQYQRSKNPSANYRRTRGQTWNAVIEGCVRTNDETSLLKAIEQMKELSVVPPLLTACSIVDFYLTRDDLDAAFDWYPHKTIVLNDNLTLEQIAAASRSACGTVLVSLRKGRNEDCEALIRQLTEGHSSKAWDAVILWAAGNGKGPDEISRMMDVMMQRSASAKNPYEPDSVTINNLIELANMRKDPYLAERFIHLGESRGISPDAKTFIMQMEYRLSISDIDGARAAYLRLRATDTSGNQDVPVVNRLIQTMLATRRYPDETIMALVDDLNERNGLFDVDTVAALTLFHLQRDELHDLVDLLHTQTFNFSIAERDKVRDVLVNFCLDSKNNNTRAWDAYVICHQVFSETGRDIRTRIMQAFFERRRGDMAVHVFDAMRQHQDPAIRANADTYAEAFMGIGRSADIESLETIHNQMRIDQEIDRPPTRLYNALMFAYSECGQPGRAFAFWNDIATSREGPSLNSIIIAFYVCERTPGQGDRIAQDIWEKLMKMDVEMTRELLTSYACALAGNQLVEEAKEVIKGMEEEYSMKPDVQTLGTLYNATLGSFHKSLVMEWIRDTYPTIFADLRRLAGKEQEAAAKVEKEEPSARPVMRLAGRGHEEIAKNDGRRPPAMPPMPAFEQYGDWKIEIDRGLKP